MHKNVRKRLFKFTALTHSQINLVTCKNIELMAGSQYPQTTRSLIKTGLHLDYHIIFLFSR